MKPSHLVGNLLVGAALWALLFWAAQAIAQEGAAYRDFFGCKAADGDGDGIAQRDIGAIERGGRDCLKPTPIPFPPVLPLGEWGGCGIGPELLPLLLLFAVLQKKLGRKLVQ